MTKRFAGKTVVVTGAGRGIGRAIAFRFAAEGAAVALISRSPEPLDDATREIAVTGAKAMAVRADVSRPEEVADAARRITNELGPIDVLVNNAGMGSPIPFIGGDMPAWDRLIKVNLYGAIHCTQSFVPSMIKKGPGGAIVNISSIHSYRVEEMSSAYDVAKGGLDQFTRAMALELAPHGIRVNGVAPGFVNTDMAILPDGTSELDTPWFSEVYVSRRKIPLARAGEPEEIAASVAFLASNDASYVNGAILVVDGGLSITF
jgi:3-oxoacyl-[acyl-carrier protein] reductase